MRSKFAKKLIKECSHANRVAISGHIDPDFDAIGSCMALKNILSKKGIIADILVDSNLDKSFDYLLQGYKPLDSIQYEYDIAISVDCSNKKRLSNTMLNIWSKCKTFNLDHHKDNEIFADYNLVESRSSACEVIYYHFNNIIKFDKTIALPLYVGIYGDTGGFIYSNVTTDTFSALATLIKTGLDADIAVRETFKLTPKQSMEMTKRAFNSIQFYDNDQIVVSVLRKSDFDEVKANLSQAKFIVGYLQNIEGVKVAISITEVKEKEYNVSLRTASDNIDVSQIATRFNGGGHLRASGLTLKGDLKKALNALILQTKKMIKCVDL